MRWKHNYQKNTIIRDLSRAADTSRTCTRIRPLMDNINMVDSNLKTRGERAGFNGDAGAVLDRRDLNRTGCRTATAAILL